MPPGGDRLPLTTLSKTSHNCLPKSSHNSLPLFRCGHCKHLTPEYKKVGATVAADAKLKSRVVIAKVDADEHRSLGERFGVSGELAHKALCASGDVAEHSVHV